MTSLLQGTAKRRAVPEPHDRHHTMNILMITANDPAGMGIAFTNAVNRYTEHTCRLITTTEMYGLDFEEISTCRTYMMMISEKWNTY